LGHVFELVHQRKIQLHAETLDPQISQVFALHADDENVVFELRVSFEFDLKTETFSELLKRLDSGMFDSLHVNIGLGDVGQRELVDNADRDESSGVEHVEFLFEKDEPETELVGNVDPAVLVFVERVVGDFLKFLVTFVEVELHIVFGGLPAGHKREVLAP